MIYNRKCILSILIIPTFIFLFQACKHEPLYPIVGDPIDSGGIVVPAEEGCDPDSIYFQNQVLPIFQSNCAMSGCHNSSSAQKGVILDSYINIMNTGDVHPGNPAISDVYEVIIEADPNKRMPPPPNNPLTSEQIGIIRKWIEQGAKNLSCSSTTCDTSNVTFASSVKPIIESKCQGCHSGSAPSGGLDFSTHGGVQSVALNGKLYGSITHSSGFVSMPQGGTKLPDCDIRKIKIWIDAGALNN